MFELTPFISSGRHLGKAYDPFREMEEMERRFFGTPNTFGTDIEDNGKAYIVSADLPGFNKEDITIDLSGDTLTVIAEHKEEKKNDSENFLRRERYYGSYSRSFDVSSVDVDNIEAAYRNGVLTLELPKKKEEKIESKSIKIKD